MPLSLLLAAPIAIGLVVIQLIITGTGLVQLLASTVDAGALLPGVSLPDDHSRFLVLQFRNVLVLLDVIRAQATSMYRR